MNSRNQVLQLRMGNSPTNGSLMHLTFDYGEFDQNENVDTTKNAGNIVRQNINLTGLANPFVQTYKYDSLDRITEAKETVNGGQTWIQQFGYDRYGNRISHCFVYDGLGKLIGEYSTDGPPQNPGVSYTATDPLGSPRVLTNEMGQVISRRDFHPFGEAIAADPTYRTSALKYGVADNVRQKFTGYERDAETGLDFAEARYYYNNHGRFTAADPLLASGKSADPQTFNRYVYALNKPLILTDPTGLQAGGEPPEEPGIVQIHTVDCSLLCSLKRGFNQLVRTIIGKDNWYQDEDIAKDERKRTGPDKRVGNAVKNYLNDLDTATDAVIDNEPTRVGNALRTVVDNDIGRASNADVWKSFGEAGLNIAATIVPAGKGGKLLPPLRDHTGKVHGVLPKVKEFANYSKEDLGIFLGELKQSVKKRIERTVDLGRERKHGQRQGEEQDLIKALEKYLAQ